MYVSHIHIMGMLHMKSIPDLVAARAFHPVTWYLKREKNFSSPLFLLHSGWPTYIQIRTHTPNLTSFSTWYKKCSLLQLVLQMLLYITVLHLALISVTVTAILLPSILLEFLSFEHAFQLNLLRKPTQQRSQMIWEGKMSTPELCIASKRFFSVGTKVV